MAVTRLTKGMRNTILDRLLKRRFSSEESKLQRERETLAMAIYDDIYPIKVREKMLGLEPGWLPMKAHMYVNLGSATVQFTLPKERPFLAKHSQEWGSGRVMKVYDAKSHAYIRYYEIEDKKAKLKELKTKLQNQTRSLLFSVTTVEKLLELWPDVAPFCTDIAAFTMIANLPAGLPKQLTEDLWLDEKVA